MSLEFEDLELAEQKIYCLLELREKIYNKYNDDEIDDELLELITDIAEELDVDIETLINM